MEKKLRPIFGSLSPIGGEGRVRGHRPQRFEIIRLQIDRGAEMAFGEIRAAGAKLRGAELDPAIRSVGLHVGEAGELLNGVREIVLIEVKAAEIVAGGSQFVVEDKSLATYWG